MSKKKSVDVSRSRPLTNIPEPIDYSSKGTPQLVFGKQGSRPGQFLCPSYVTVSPRTGNIFVCDKGNNRIQIYTNTGQLLDQFGSQGDKEGQFSFVEEFDDVGGGLTFTPKHNLIVADSANNRIQMFTEEGKFIKVFSDGYTFPFAVCCDKSGLIYFCNRHMNGIEVIHEDGRYETSFKLNGVNKKSKRKPHGMAVCPNGDIVVSMLESGYVCSRSAGSVDIYTSKGNLRKTVTFSNCDPYGVAVDLDGNIVLADCAEDEEAVRIFDATGKKICSFTTDRMYHPVGITSTADNQIVVVDDKRPCVAIF